MKFAGRGKAGVFPHGHTQAVLPARHQTVDREIIRTDVAENTVLDPFRGPELSKAGDFLVFPLLKRQRFDFFPVVPDIPYV